MTIAKQSSKSDRNPATSLQSDDALLIVDVQNDFLPGGSLAVVEGDAVVPVLNRYIDRFAAKGLAVFATRDWHPPDHCSFVDQDGTWPPHCVAESPGAAFATALRLPAQTRIVSKAIRRDKDAYSGFEGSDLDSRLKQLHIQRLFVGGLATDYCVLNSVRDAIKLGYAVVLLRDAVRAVNLAPEDGRRAEEEMIGLGALPLTFDELGT